MPRQGLAELVAAPEAEAQVHGAYPMFATAPALFLTSPTSLLLEWWFLPADWVGMWSWTGPVLLGALLNIAAFKGIRALVSVRIPGAEQ